MSLNAVLKAVTPDCSVTRACSVTPARAATTADVVTPAKAGVSRGQGARYRREIPAFAGMTDRVGIAGFAMTDMIATANRVATTGMDA